MGSQQAYEQYVRYGISCAGIRHVVSECQVDATTTTSQFCQKFIKPRTVPPGWTDTPKVTDAERGYYAHTYLNKQTGEVVTTAPEGTRSLCQMLREDPQTARFVNKPTIFLSHAWLFLILNLLGAVESFVSALPPGEPEPFFWFDCFSIDQHAQSKSSALGSEWWRDAFERAIGQIGHTVM